MDKGIMDNILINALTIRNLLSFGSDTGKIPLKPLNVIIGPNGSGKSNLIEIISLFQAMSKDLKLPVRKGGGIMDWLWKGEKDPIAAIAADVKCLPFMRDDLFLRHSISFTAVNQRFELIDECIENSGPGPGEKDACFYYRYENNHPVLNVKSGKQTLRRESVDPEQSILSQRKDPDQYPELTWLGEQFGRIKIYREWIFGRYAPLRQPQESDAPNDYLEEDCRNLGLVLNSIKKTPRIKRRIIELLGEFYEGIEDFDVSIEGGSVQLFLTEGDFSIPATRLSDGTLRYLCLLAVLCHPKPPPLICIEEPELGIHTDIIPVLATLLKEAATRTQLIVTTHSEALVDELSDTPDSILVCEKKQGCTEFKRLETDDLKDWLKKYSLGELWRKGEIGGNRW
ncbi:MAG: chromosome segregation protein SMC [Desulfobacterales bacterium RIFOXYA12_FULL_46_15]|nr:MAG: chromosome segregation protein SMC [Desulfobacula sp. GWF2_41_7]OGR26983.1 MAG: chromosome segregation protein SMC [Desulfobacterales bacterium RIFOXYA12_FULL_46_15]